MGENTENTRTHNTHIHKLQQVENYGEIFIHLQVSTARFNATIKIKITTLPLEDAESDDNDEDGTDGASDNAGRHEML
ncbi:hypothetical protein Bpfe_019515 [Biomphalaria pfeifferi]|uniref:Uncharacterized protein n=1 Tax=Biomphalaria pfeifferi TaxID=112525 RepID=A0AAD8BAB3_BIOPF|nr:hypothetical protein Bpfe_019515 [Biomphalaria pfeifferi]